jgi:hypothetical protein
LNNTSNAFAAFLYSLDPRPGSNGLAALLAGRSLGATQPRHFFQPDGPMPEALEISLALPPELGPPAEVLTELHERVRAVEHKRHRLPAQRAAGCWPTRRVSHGRGVVNARRSSRAEPATAGRDAKQVGAARGAGAQSQLCPDIAKDPDPWAGSRARRSRRVAPSSPSQSNLGRVLPRTGPPPRISARPRRIATRSRAVPRPS